MTVGEFVNQIVIDSVVFGFSLLYNRQLPDLIQSQGKITIHNLWFVPHNLGLRQPRTTSLWFTCQCIVKAIVCQST